MYNQRELLAYDVMTSALQTANQDASPGPTPLPAELRVRDLPVYQCATPRRQPGGGAK